MRGTKQPTASSSEHLEVDLITRTSVVNISASTAMNSLCTAAPLSDILYPNPANQALISDVDEQLLIKIIFKDPVTIAGVVIRATDCQVDESAAPPKLIKFYANREALDFSEIDEIDADQEFELTENDSKGDKRLNLRGLRFQKCQTLQLFIASNVKDAEKTFINHISLSGFVCAPYTHQYAL